jgi:predicted metal-dependent TIM-barrel fold hydrolase
VLFDAILDPSGLTRRDVDDLRWFGVVGALCTPGEVEAPATAAAWRRAWDDLAGPTLARLRRRGFAAYAALGVPPLRIPWRGLEELLAELPEWLSRPGVVAIGPVGLDRGTEREAMVLVRQLALAADLRLPVLLGTPSRGRSEATRRSLALVREAGLDPRRVLVQADARTVRPVRAVGCAAVVSAGGGDGDGAVDRAARLVRSLGAEGIVIASGAGEGSADLLALPRAADRMERLGLSDAVIRRACGRNALAALGLEPSSVRSRARASSARSGRPTSR